MTPATIVSVRMIDVIMDVFDRFKPKGKPYPRMSVGPCSHLTLQWFWKFDRETFCDLADMFAA